MDQLICASLSHNHYWYEVGMLKVPAYIIVLVVLCSGTRQKYFHNCSSCKMVQTYYHSGKLHLSVVMLSTSISRQQVVIDHHVVQGYGYLVQYF